MIGWRNVPIGQRFHLIPLEDLREHEATMQCWCVPEEDNDDPIVIHNSADGRELFERGERKPS